MSVRALTLNEIPEVESVQVTSLSAQDVIVVHVSRHLPPDEWQRINEVLRLCFPHHKSLLIPEYAKLEVVHIQSGEADGHHS